MVICSRNLQFVSSSKVVSLKTVRQPFQPLYKIRDQHVLYNYIYSIYYSQMVGIVWHSYRWAFTGDTHRRVWHPFITPTMARSVIGNWILILCICELRLDWNHMMKLKLKLCVHTLNAKKTIQVPSTYRTPAILLPKLGHVTGPLRSFCAW